MNFITGQEFSQSELKEIIELALQFKATGDYPDFSDKILTLIFANPSLRTRLSFESGFKKMGGKVNVLSSTDTWDFEYEDGVVMDSDKQEHIKEAAKVISGYTDLIALRKCDLMTKNSTTAVLAWPTMKQDQAINALSNYSTKPVINMESNVYHPCQAMADMMTVKEELGQFEGKKLVLTWAPHPKSLPLATPHSQLLCPSLLGMDVTLACPEGFELDEDVMQASGATVVHSQEEAFKDADVVIAKSWASLTGAQPDPSWKVSQQKMNLTNNAIFMHCLPVRRNVVVDDEVLDSDYSKHIQEAENRMWVQMAIITKLLTQ